MNIPSQIITALHGGRISPATRARIVSWRTLLESAQSFGRLKPDRLLAMLCHYAAQHCRESVLTPWVKDITLQSADAGAPSPDFGPADYRRYAASKDDYAAAFAVEAAFWVGYPTAATQLAIRLDGGSRWLIGRASSPGQRRRERADAARTAACLMGLSSPTPGA